jgi:hypothetical protein
MSTEVNTPYASFNAASHELASNGGAWYTSRYIPSIITPHQSMSGMTDLIRLTGYMEASVVIPNDLVQAGDTIEQYVHYIVRHSSYLNPHSIALHEET